MRFPNNNGARESNDPNAYPIYAPIIMVIGKVCHGRSLHDGVSPKPIFGHPIRKDSPVKGDGNGAKPSTQSGA